MALASLFDPFTGQEQIGEKEKLLFLLSPSYCNLLRKMVVGLTSNHKLTVYLLSPDNPELAFTDGLRIMINTLHMLFAKEPIEKITEYCLGLASHESWHPLYSCFECIQDAAKRKPGDNDNIIQIRRELFNILEDGRIERIGSFKFPGVAYAIESLNEFLFSIPKDMSKSKDIEIMMQWILDFVSVGRTRGELIGDLKKLWDKIQPLALKAKYSDTCSGCYFYTKKILKLLKPLIPETDPIEQQRQKAQNVQGNQQDVDAKTGQQPPSPSQGNSQNSGGGKGSQQPGQAPGQGQAPASSAASGQNGQGNGQGAGQGSGQDAADAMSQMLTNALNASFNEHQKDMAAGAQDKKTAKGIADESCGAFKVIPFHGDFSTFDEYTRIKTDVSPVINKLRTGLKNIINYNVDEVSRYLHAGRIDSKSLSRMPSGAICAKRIEKNDEADLNITVLVDLSGSMGGMPVENAMKACVVLQEVCESLKIPITVLGFKSGKPSVHIFHFSDRRLKGRYSHTGIVKMQAGGSTPLYNALLYLPRLLTKQAEEDKLVIVITDGAPDGGPEQCRTEVLKLGKLAKVYGMAIGGGREALENIFGSKYIGVDSLSKLPGELCKVVERNIIRR